MSAPSLWEYVNQLVSALGGLGLGPASSLTLTVHKDGKLILRRAHNFDSVRASCVLPTTYPHVNRFLLEGIAGSAHRSSYKHRKQTTVWGDARDGRKTCAVLIALILSEVLQRHHFVQPMLQRYFPAAADRLLERVRTIAMGVSRRTLVFDTECRCLTVDARRAVHTAMRSEVSPHLSKLLLDLVERYFRTLATFGRGNNRQEDSFDKAPLPCPLRPFFEGITAGFRSGSWISPFVGHDTPKSAAIEGCVFRYANRGQPIQMTCADEVEGVRFVVVTALEHHALGSAYRDSEAETSSDSECSSADSDNGPQEARSAAKSRRGAKYGRVDIQGEEGAGTSDSAVSAGADVILSALYDSGIRLVIYCGRFPEAVWGLPFVLSRGGNVAGVHPDSMCVIDGIDVADGQRLCAVAGVLPLQVHGNGTSYDVGDHASQQDPCVGVCRGVEPFPDGIHCAVRSPHPDTSLQWSLPVTLLLAASTSDAFADVVRVVTKTVRTTLLTALPGGDRVFINEVRTIPGGGATHFHCAATLHTEMNFDAVRSAADNNTRLITTAMIDALLEVPLRVASTCGGLSRQQLLLRSKMRALLAGGSGGFEDGVCGTKSCSSLLHGIVVDTIGDRRLSCDPRQDGVVDSYDTFIDVVSNMMATCRTLISVSYTPLAIRR